MMTLDIAKNLISYWSTYQGLSFTTIYLYSPGLVPARQLTSLHDVFKKHYLKNKQKIWVRFSIMDPPAKPSQKKKPSSYWKFIEVTHLGKFGRGRVIINLLKLSFFILILSTGVPQCRLPLDGATDFQATVSFV